MTQGDEELLASRLDEAVFSPEALTIHDLNAVVRDAAIERWSSGDFAGAVRAAWFALRDLLRERLGRPDLDGENLVNAIGETGPHPALPLTDYGTPTEQNMHRGIVQLLKGTVFYVRHPDAHESESPASTDRVSAFECLTVMSLCARYVAASASPTVVDDALSELLEPRFPDSQAALDDVARTVPRRRLDEFAGRLYDAATAAFVSADSTLCNKLHRAEATALGAASWDPDLVSRAAARAERLIARDETLEPAMRLLHGPVFARLAPRYREKVEVALETMSEASLVDHRELIEAFDVLARIAEERRNRIYDNLIASVQSDDQGRHLWATVVLMRNRSVLSQEQIATFTTILVSTVARTDSGALANLIGSVGRRPDPSGKLRASLAGALRLQAGIDAPGAAAIDRALLAFEAKSDDAGAVASETVGS